MPDLPILALKAAGYRLTAPCRAPDIKPPRGGWTGAETIVLYPPGSKPAFAVALGGTDNAWCVAWSHWRKGQIDAGMDH